jgi:hypothetical protein
MGAARGIDPSQLTLNQEQSSIRIGDSLFP